MTFTKESITRSFFDSLDLSKAASASAVEVTFEIIKNTLEAGEDVLITGFGKLCVKYKAKRWGRNPDTVEDLMLAERTDRHLQVLDSAEEKFEFSVLSHGMGEKGKYHLI